MKRFAPVRAIVVNPKGIVYLDKVVEAVPSKYARGLRASGGNCGGIDHIAADKHSVDLIGESVFANFGA